MAVAPAAAPAPPPPDDAAPPDDTDTGDTDTGQDNGETVVCTITKSADGTYTVYPGDEPEEEGEGEDQGEAGQGGAPGAPGGAPEGEDEGGVKADSVGAALKAAMTILHADEENSGGDQMAAGFSTGNMSGTPPAGGNA